MLTNMYKSILFISAFMPLYIILIVKFYNFDESIRVNIIEHKYTFLILSILILISILAFLYFLFCELNSEEDIGQVENMNSEILTYFITYIVPLTTLEESNVNSIIINIILFFVIGIFYVNSNQFYLNILFTLFGFNVYKDSNGKIIISKKSADKINNRQAVRVKRVGHKIFIINKK